MSSFLYSPLKDTNFDLRLLLIRSGQYNDDLDCRLLPHTDIVRGTDIRGDDSRKWKYQALSYTWGDGSRKVPISINGKPFLVTENLDSALRHLRCAAMVEADRQLPLWID
jgi:hypothetical protein